MRSAGDAFIERDGDFDDLDAYVGGETGKLFALVGPAGLGKSTLLANWVARWKMRAGRAADEAMVVRFIGVGQGASTIDSLLRSILEELRRDGRLASEIPDGSNSLRSKLGQLLGECAAQGPLVIVLDALNQLQSGLADLDWLPRTLPERVRLIVSFKVGDPPGDALVAALRSDARVTVAEVRPFTSLQHRRELVSAYLRQYLKELDENHLEALIRADGADNPLFLRVVLSELRVFGAFARLGDVLRHEFGNSPQSAFDAILRRLETDPGYSALPPRYAVPLVFGLLAHARRGLPEDLLVSMLHPPHTSGELSTEATRATIRLYLRQVRPFLATRDGRTDFFYEAFQLAARARYATTEAETRAWHARLARACACWPGLVGESRRYALAGLPHHQLEGGNGPAAAAVLTDFAYHRERLRALGRQEVGEVDADFARTTTTTNLSPALHERLRIWGAFYRENVHIVRRPDDGLSPETALLQLAVAHADTSPVTSSAEAWLESTGSEVPWLRSGGRPCAIEHSACVRTLEGHIGSVCAMLLHPDGRRCVTGGGDATVRVWDLKTGRCLLTLQAEQTVHKLALHSDGRRVLSGGDQGEVAVWNIETGERVHHLSGHTGYVKDIALHPDDRRAISASGDRTLRVWDLDTGACLHTLTGHQEWVNTVLVLRDGRRVLSGSSDKSIKIWDIDTGRCLRTIEVGTKQVWQLTSSADGHRVLSAIMDGTVRIWDAETLACLHVCEANQGWTSAIDLIPGGGRMVSGGEDGVVKVWDIETGRCLRTIPASTADLTALAHHLDGRRIATAGSDGVLRTWDVETGQYLGTMAGHAGRVEGVAFHPVRSWLVSASYDGTIKIWDLDAGQTASGEAGPAARVLALAHDGEGKCVLAARSDGAVQVWDVETGNCTRTLTGHTEKVTAVALHPDGRRAVSSGEDGLLKIWDVETGKCRRTAELRMPTSLPGYDLTKTPDAITISPGGDQAISTAWGALPGLGVSPEVKVWDLRSAKCVRASLVYTCRVTLDASMGWREYRDSRRRGGASDPSMEYELPLQMTWDLAKGGEVPMVEGSHRHEVTAVAVADDGRRLLTGSRDRTIKIWDTEEGKCLRTIEGPTAGVEALALQPGGRQAVSSDYDRAIKLWDLETGACLRTFRGPTSYIVAMTVDRDGKRLVTACGDRSLRLWNLESGECVATWQARSALCSCAMVADLILAGTEGGEVAFLRLMRAGRIGPESTAAAWHPTRLELAAAREHGTVVVLAWHPASQHLEELTRATLGIAIAQLQWSHDGNHLCATTRDGSRHTLLAETLQEVAAATSTRASRFGRFPRRLAPTPSDAFTWLAPSDLSADGGWRARLRDRQLEILSANRSRTPLQAADLRDSMKESPR